MKILIVRVSSLGDVIHNMPMVADILRHHPQASIDWVVEEAYTDLVRLNGQVRKVIPFALRRWRKTLWSPQTRAEMRAFHAALRDEEYDFVFDTQGLVKTGIVMRMARTTQGGRRVGLANGTEGSGYEAFSRLFHMMSVPVALRTHAVQRARIVASTALNYSIDDDPHFGLRAPDAAVAPWLPKEPYAVFFHGTARAAKRWDDGDWVRLAKEVSARGLPILLPWGNDAEQRTANDLASNMQNARVLPRLSMMEAVALAQRAALVVGVDTGLTHIAAAYNRPTIELYCDSPRWKTEGTWSKNIINLGDTGKPPSLAQAEQAVSLLMGPAAKRAVVHSNPA